MDELTGVGSAAAGNPAGGNGGAPEGSGTPAAATDNRSAEAGNLDWAKAKGWVNETGQLDAAKLADGYQSLEKRLGSMVTLPDEKAAPEDRDAFFKKLGWPGDPKGYEFARPDGLPEDVPYDEGMAERFKAWANEAKLPKAAAQALHDQYVKQFAEDVKAYEAELVTKAKAAHETLVKEWGDPKSEAYLKNRDAAVRALRSEKLSGLEDELKAAGLLTKEGFYTSPRLAALLAAAGSQLQNDALIGAGAGGGPANNPFAKVTENLTEQSLLKKSDPAKARALAAAAGWSSDQLKAVFGS